MLCARQGLSLPSVYQQARHLHDQAMSGTSEAKVGDPVQVGNTILLQCQTLVDQLGLFSSNEDADDLATADLKYMLVPAMHGDILAQTSARDPEVRRQTLQTAIKLYSRFLSMCNQYGLLSQDAKAAAQVEGQQSLDQNTRRLQKVQRFKREREIKAELGAMQMKQMRMVQLQDEADLPHEQDEESEREVGLLHTELEVMNAIEQIHMLQQEVNLLEHAASIPPDQRQTQTARPPPPDVMQQLLGAAANLQTQQTQRQRLQAQVFRPTVALPTVSVEQQGAIELQKMQQAQQREATAAASKSQDQDSEEDSDAQVDKQRQMDDWNDDNPSGWGNSKLRPTA
ncbi:hypothetical protein ABBQ38_015401 [Trebouxia sp. C0009 RCD-2024]